MSSSRARLNSFLEMLQNKAVRFISGLKGRDGVTRERELLGLDTLQNRRKAQRVKTFHLILQSINHSLKELNDFIAATSRLD